MEPKFQWEDKKAGKFLLHGLRYFAYYDQWKERIVYGRNYACGITVDKYTKSMHKTLLKNWEEIKKEIGAKDGTN